MNDQYDKPPYDLPGSSVVLDRADRIVAIVGGVSLARARVILHNLSARTHIKERHVAELLVDWASSGHLPADLHSELRRQLDESRERTDHLPS